MLVEGGRGESEVAVSRLAVKRVDVRREADAKSRMSDAVHRRCREEDIPDEEEPLRVPAVHLLGGFYSPHAEMRVGLSIDLELRCRVEVGRSVVSGVAADGGGGPLLVGVV